MTGTPTERVAEGPWVMLRRRKVVQWGLAYVAGAWGLLQGLEYVTDTFHWPEQIQQLTTIALFVGVPVVLVLAWYHGDRGEQRVTRTEFVIITLLFMVGGGLFWRVEREIHTATPAGMTTAPAPSPAADARPSIAVIPFENRSRLDDDASFVDGIHDDILTQLSKVGAMKVIARTSVEQFRGTKLTTKEIGERLGVTNVLEGGVQRAGDRVRINVQLIDARSDAHLWAETYDRELTAANVFAIQSEIAAAIAGALKTALTPGEQASVDSIPTHNLEAWEAYQLGKQRMARRTTTALADAEQFFRTAIDLDPKFALAYVGLANALTLQIEYSGAPRESALSNADKAVAEALALDRQLAEAWASAGLIASSRHQPDRATSMYQRALEINPNYAPAHHWYSIVLGAVGRRDESLTHIERAVALDPLSAVINETLGEALVGHGRFDEADAAFRKAITIDPSKPTPYLGLADMSAYALGDFAGAIRAAERAMELDPGSPHPCSVLARLYRDLGDDGKFFETVAQASVRWPDEPLVHFHLAVVDLFRLDAAAAVPHAQRAFDGYPRGELALAILRDSDLKRGRYDAALARYEEAYPEFFVHGEPRVHGSNIRGAVDLALVFQQRGDSKRASALLDGAARAIGTIPRLGFGNYEIADVQIHALRGHKAEALAALREAERAGWRRLWRYYRDFDPTLASIRGEPEFRAVFANIERDMGRQRAELAARTKAAPLDLAVH